MTKMTKTFQALTIAILFVLAFSSVALAQQSKEEKVPVKLQIVFSKYDGDRKISSLPYTVFVTANGDRQNISIGSNVPVTNTSTNAETGKTTTTSSYTNVGTNVDITVTTESGRYKVSMNLRDNYVMATKPIPGSTAKPSELQTFGNFSFNGGVNLKEGETKQIISAADRATGEVTKVDLTLTLDK